MGSQHYLPPDTGECIPASYMERGPDHRIYCCNLPSSEASTKLYCLVNRGTCVRTTCPRLLHGSALSGSRIKNHVVSSLAHYHYSAKPHRWNEWSGCVWVIERFCCRCTSRMSSLLNLRHEQLLWPIRARFDNLHSLFYACVYNYYSVILECCSCSGGSSRCKWSNSRGLVTLTLQFKSHSSRLQSTLSKLPAFSTMSYVWLFAVVVF